MIAEALKENFTAWELGQLYDEIIYNPAIKPLIQIIAESPDPREAIKESVAKALINEFDPTRFPESQNDWLLTRFRTRTLIKDLVQSAKEGKELVSMRLEGLGYIDIGTFTDGAASAGEAIGGEVGDIISGFDWNKLLGNLINKTGDFLISKYTTELQGKYQLELAELMNNLKTGQIPTSLFESELDEIKKEEGVTISPEFWNEYNKMKMLLEQKEKMQAVKIEQILPWAIAGIAVVGGIIYFATR